MLPDEAAALVAAWAGRPVPVLPIRQVRQSRGYSGARPIRPESRTRTTRRDNPREGSSGQAHDDALKYQERAVLLAIEEPER